MYCTKRSLERQNYTRNKKNMNVYLQIDIVINKI